jgi:hypothetical protein
MRHIKKLTPSPATVIACLALFVAIGGVGYAASEIGKNDVTSKQIKNKSVLGKDFKPNTLGGKQVNEGKLGAVAGATSADTANSLAGTIRVWRRVPSSAFNADYDTARDAATKVVLGGSGPFTVYGKCFKIDSANDYVTAAIYIESTQLGGLLSGYSGDTSGDLGPATPEDDRELITDDAVAGNVSIYDYGNFEALAADGTVLTANVGVYEKEASAPESGGILGAGDACMFRYEQRTPGGLQSG